MDQKPCRARRRRSSFAAAMVSAAILLAVLLLYVLSYGPACDAVIAGEVNCRVFATAYYPITWTCKRSEFARHVMASYRFMWDRRDPPKSPIEDSPPRPRRFIPR